MTRPSDRRSIVASSLASIAGWRKSFANTLNPKRTRFVTAAAAASAGIGASWALK